MRTDSNVFDVRSGFTLLFKLSMNLLCSFDSGLGMKFGCSIKLAKSSAIKEDRPTRIGDFEENILHYIASIWPLKLEFISFEKDIIESPDGS